MQDIYEECKLMQLHEFSEFYLCKFAKHFLSDNKEKFIPIALNNFITPTVPNRTTRNNSSNFNVPKYDKKLYETSVRIRLVHCWNNLPIDIRNTKEYDTFTFKLNQYLLNIR
jgi:hypothetical protein